MTNSQLTDIYNIVKQWYTFEYYKYLPFAHVTITLSHVQVAYVKHNNPLTNGQMVSRLKICTKIALSIIIMSFKIIKH